MQTFFAFSPKHVRQWPFKNSKIAEISQITKISKLSERHENFANKLVSAYSSIFGIFSEDLFDHSQTLPELKGPYA